MTSSTFYAIILVQYRLSPIVHITAIAILMVPLQSIQLATRCSGARRFNDDNTSETWKGPIQTEHGQKVAFVKVLPTNQLISEAVCALLARALGFDVPTPYVVQVHKAQLKESKTWSTDETRKICFGSEEISHPSLKRVMNPKHNGKIVHLHPDIQKKIWDMTTVRLCQFVSIRR